MGFKARWAIIIFFVLLVGITFMYLRMKEGKLITVDDARKVLATDSTVLVLDVRTPEEYKGELGHIDHALLIPIQDLEKRINELDAYKGKTILAVCRTGRRSGTATEILTKKGFIAKNVEGGMVKWNEEKLPVVREVQ